MKRSCMDTKGYRHEQAANIGALIRQFRKFSGMSQMKLSEIIGVSYQQVQKYEYGTSELTIARIRQIADALKVPVDVFFEKGGGVAKGGGSLGFDEVMLLTVYRRLKNEELKRMAIKMLGTLTENSWSG